MPRSVVSHSKLLVVLLVVVASAAWRLAAAPRSVRADQPALDRKAGSAEVPARNNVQEVPTRPTLIGTGVNNNTGITGAVVLFDEDGSDKKPKQSKPTEPSNKAGSLPAQGRSPRLNATQRLAASRRILDALDEPVSLHFENAPLRDVLKRIAEIGHLSVVADDLGLEEIGTSIDARVSIKVADLKLRSALHLLLEPMGLDFAVVDDFLKITSQRRANELRLAQDGSTLRTLRPDVPELSVALVLKEECVVHCLARIKAVDGFDATILRVSAPSATELRLRALDAGNTALTVIDEQDNKYTVRVNVRAVVVNDEASELEHLLQRLYPTAKLDVIRIRDAMLVRGSVSEQQQAVEIVEIAEQYAPRVLNQIRWPTVPNQPATALPSLKKPAASGTPNAALASPAARVESPAQDASKNPFVLEPSAANVQLPASEPKRDRRPVPAGDDVRELRNDLRELHRDVRRLIELLESRKDAPKEATSERPRSSDAGDTLTTKVYAVADLVVPIPEIVRLSLNADVWQADRESRQAPGIDPNIQANLIALTKLLEGEIEPASWKNTNGKGVIAVDGRTISLVISQTNVVHGRIAARLDEMRRQLDVQIVAEMRFVSIPADNLPVDYLKIMGDDHVLQPDQATRLVNHFQADTRTNIMAAPKVTLFNGQSWEVSGWSDVSPQTKILLHTMVDGSQTVRLSTAINARDAADALRSGSVHRVPSGGTVVLDVTDQMPAVAEVKTPVLEKVPYVNRLFRQVSSNRTALRTLLLITPRIIAVEEEESR